MVIWAGLNRWRKRRRKVMSRGRRNSHWEVDLDLVKNCSKGPVRKVVWLGRVAKTKIDVLMRKYSNQEWFAYLLGEELRVQDIFIPEQRAGSNFISDVNCEEYNKLNIIGAMHSHPWQGNNFSSHDDEFVNGNHDVSLLVSKSGLSGQVRVKVPCGAMYVVPADVRLDLEVDFNKKNFLEEVEDKINKFRAQSKQVHSGSGYVNTTPAGAVPAHHKTFPLHHDGCSCTQCQQDRRQWLRLQTRLSKKEKEDISKSTTQSWDTEDTTFEGGAWICEECQKMNYVDTPPSDGQPIDECAWCNSPRIEAEVTLDEDPELDIDMLDMEIRELEDMFEVPTEVNQEMQDAVDKKYDETMDKLDEETLLDASLEIAAKYLVLIKQLYDGGVYKVQFDLFADKLTLEFAEPEDSITDELHMVVNKIEKQLHATEEVNPLYGKISAGKIHLVPEAFIPAIKKGQQSTHDITYMCGQMIIATDKITEDRPTNNESDLCKHCFPPEEESTTEQSETETDQEHG